MSSVLFITAIKVTIKSYDALVPCLNLAIHVGQSLYSSHLDAVYASNHAFIDPQIWYDEHEMRKQVEQSAGCFILTAQEKPENARKMREDLFKKTMSADGIAGRRPYGISTRMIELVGWKRYEVNSELRKKTFHPLTDVGSCGFRRLVS